MNRSLVKAYAAKMAAESGRKVALVDAEAEIVRVVQQVARNLAPSYTFGYHSREDIEQDGVIEALVVLDSGKYDVTRPLENFLYTHVKNRLFNAKRNKYFRPEAPCDCCDPFNPPPQPCRKWHDWFHRNSTKQNLMRPLDVACVSDEGELNMSVASTVVEDATVNELLLRIDDGLPPDLRSDYLRMRGGVAVPKARRQRVREAILVILAPAGPEEDA